MAVRIEPYSADHVSAVVAFNARLDAGNIETGFRLETSPVPAWLPPDGDAFPRQEFFVAVDGESVRGGYALKHQQFQLNGAEEVIGFFRAPISEGLIDKRFLTTGAILVRDALARRPIQFALGMGSLARPLPRMLRGMGWRLAPVPFLYRLFRPHRVLRGLRAVRTTPWRRLALSAAAWSGAATAGCLLLQTSPPPVDFQELDQFDAADIDSLWGEVKDRYSFCAVRNAAVLERLYPPGNRRFLRLALRDRGRFLGWAVIMDTVMRDDQYFGDLRVGSLIDCLALPGQETAVVAAATRFMEQRGADMAIANLAHADWVAAGRRCGWRFGPTNFFLAASPKLTARLEPWEITAPRIHLLRGDGDGPIHL